MKSFRGLRVCACLTGLTVTILACELPAVRGRVVDRESGAPIAGAIVVELYREAGWMGEPARARHARFATSDGAGRFELPASRTSVASDLFAGDYPPVYVFAHPAYGMIHAGEVAAVDGAIELRASQGEIVARQALASLCESPPREDWERTLASHVCGRR